MQHGQLLCGGFQGTTVTPQAYELIVDHHVSTMILSRKNAVSVPQITKLIRDLQNIAHNEGAYQYPIMFAIDEEGGMMNTLFDPERLTQYPSAMAMSASSDTELVYEVSRAIAKELRHIGFSIILGPVLDVVTKLSHQLVSVRSFGTTVDDVVKYGSICAKGLQDGGLFTFGKHFPGIGNAAVDSLLELPTIGDTLDQIRSYNSLPFAQLINEGLLDGISVAGFGVPTISPDETHACLSPAIINQLLRSEMGFDGVVLSECLEMDALYHSIGLGQGVVLALAAGCDIVMVCHDLNLQKEAIGSIEKAVANGNIDEEALAASIQRIERLQKRLPSWDQLEGSSRLFKDVYPDQWARHQLIASTLYQKSITLVRDYSDTLPLSKHIVSGDSILLMTPLLHAIYPSSPKPDLYSGEEVFQDFGDALATQKHSKVAPYKVLHTTYTANGLTSLHESLIERSKAVIVVTSEATRNMHQVGIVKYVSILCGASPSAVRGNGAAAGFQQLSKPLIIVATSSPYDFFYSKSLGSAYLCCYDYTKTVLAKVAAALFGEFEPQGCIPGEERFQHKRKGKPAAKRRWLVDDFDLTRDWAGLVKLWKNNAPTEAGLYNEGFFRKMYALLASSKDQRHFVVRNSSLNIIYGIVFLWVHHDDGSIVYLLVERSKRMQSIGKNLHARAMRYLLSEKLCASVSMGTCFPLLTCPDEGLSRSATAFLSNMNWQITEQPKKHVMVLDDLANWSVPKKIFRELMIVGVRFDICSDSSKLMTLIDRYVADENGDKDEKQRTRLLYTEAIKYLANTSSYGVKIIIALEPTHQSVIGAVVLFTNRSQFSMFYPFVDECAGSDDVLVGGVIGPVIDPSYSNLTEIFKFGLICSGITFLKSNSGDMKKVVMVGVGDEKKGGVGDMGFREWRWFVGEYGRERSSELAKRVSYTN